MSSAFDILTSLTSEAATTESTMTTSVAAVDTSPIVIAPAAKQPRPTKAEIVAKLLKRRKLRQEAESQSVIPTDAKPDAAAQQPADKKSKPCCRDGGGCHEPFIQTSVALMAPDTTPDAEKPLDPTQVTSQVISGQTAQASNPGQPVTDDDAMRALLGEHFSAFKPALLESNNIDINACATMTPEQLKSMAKGTVASMTSPTGDSAAAAAMEAFSGKQTEPHYDENSMAKLVGAMHQLFD